MKKTCVFALALGVALPAAAHPGHEALGFAAGFVHPFGGIDHLLALLAAGLWSRQQRAAAHLPAAGMPAAGMPMAGMPTAGMPTAGMPAAFLLAMALGALVQLPLPALEAGIAATVLLLGALAASALRPARGVAFALVAAFAFLHGQAHGRELAGLASGAGFLLASAGLLATGYALGGLKFNRMLGAAIGATGLCLLAGFA